MHLVQPPPERERPTPSVGDRAVSDLDFIRSTIERSGRFPAVSGAGGVFMGVVGLAAAIVSSRFESREAWLGTWLGAAAAAFLGGAWSTRRKAAAQDVPLFSGLGRKFLLGLSPGLVAGAVLTAVLVRTEQYDALPATWLLLFGAAVTSGGAFSVRAVPLIGAGFMALGVVACFSPATWGTPLLGLGFGVLLLIGGLWIARRHGG